jgi:hypothetical protein
MVQNTTHPSRAWVYKSLGANSFDITQPMVPITVPGSVLPAEVDTWVNGDSVNLLLPVNVNIVYMKGETIDYNAAFNNRLYLYQVNVPVYTRSENNFYRDLRMAESSTYKTAIGVDPVNSETGLVMINDFNAGGVSMTSQNFLIGGCIAVASTAVNLLNATVGIGAAANTGTVIDGDFIYGAGSGNNLVIAGGAQIGRMFLDSGIEIQTGTTILAALTYGGPTLYGSAGHNVNIEGNGKMYLSSGTFTTALTAPSLVTGLLLNGTATGHSIFTAANIDTPCGGIATSVAKLDAAASATCATTGFGGTAFNPGGASVSNTLP